MAKVTRSVIKEIVKECLVEILLEGIDSEGPELALTESLRKKPAKRRTNPKMKEIQKRRDELDRQRVDTRKKPVISESAITGLTQDPLMAEIYADTAATTLANQGMANSAQDRKYVPSDAAAAAVYENNPEDLFEGSQNWAALAFPDSSKN